MSILGALTSLLPMQVPMINGVVYSFAHIELTIAGLKFTGGFKSIEYDRDREREYVYSNSPDPVGKTLGENKYKCEVEVYLAWWYSLLNTVNALPVVTAGAGLNATGGYGDKSFNLKVAYNAAGFTPFEDTILGCTFDSTAAGNSAGAGALTRKIKFNPMKIKYNGLDDLASPLQALPF